MNYFTRERYLGLQNFDDHAVSAADTDWESAVDRYETYLQTIRPEMPEAVRQLLDGFYLHDARVLSMGRRGDTFVISLQLDPPPNELLTLTYTLAGPPEVQQQLFPWARESTNVCWLYEEIELVRTGDQPSFVQSILFSNGWEVRLPFRAVQATTAFPLLPLRGRPSPGAAPGSASRTA